jgi:two-component system NtrC family sensor kinase
MRASRNFNDEFVNTFRLPIQDSLAGSVLRSGKPVILDEKTPQKIKTSYLVNSLIYVPLTLKGNVLGVLGVDNRHAQTAFKQKDISLLTAMAEFAVIAIQNAKLFDESVNEQHKLNAIIHNVEEGVLVLDQDNRVILINHVAELILNLETPVPFGISIKQLVLEPELAALFEYGTPEASVHTEIHDQHEQTYSTQITPIPGVGTAIIFHNITYLKKLDQIKNDFVSTVSHDLRSPLTAILGYVELLERVGPINTTQKEFINRVQTSVHNITNLVDDLLNLGRIEAGFDTRKEFLDLGKLVGFTIEGMHKVLQTQQQTIETNIAEDLPQIFGSPVQLRQIISNLLSNASKYSPSGSTIHVQIKQERNQLLLTIADEGFGIPAIDLPHIFEKFYRAGNISSDISGTGLGLAIVKTIVDSHHGRIWVDSVIDKGTTFTIVLPISE